ncbi:hypothetical protein MEQU1_000424 [Malassezia equina]|uniref:Coatomer subunit epsilon n=1 Tax=Malassezia equina TaxID=1381935 RepID=A0AAF0ECB3_9BASI|nr:hypothetical protein MEQU1_000424 [Malassezia equina]
MDSTTFEVQSLFYHNAYAGCIALAQKHAPHGIVDDASLLQLVYAARAALALNDVPGARQLVGEDAEHPAAMSVLLLADLKEMKALGDDAGCADVLEQLMTLLDVVEPGELTSEIVRCNVGLALYESGDKEKALETLQVTGQGGNTQLECVALGVHILLTMHRVDLAEAEYLAARHISDDSLLVQYMEAWIGMVRGGRATQQAYYVYDEMSQNTTIAHTAHQVPALVGKTVAQAAQAHTTDASSTLNEAAQLDAVNPLVSANQAVLAALTPATSSTNAERLAQQHAQAQPASELTQLWESKRRELDEALAAVA